MTGSSRRRYLRRCAALLCAAVVLSPAAPAGPMAAKDEAPAGAMTDLRAIPAPAAILAGRVLEKDGVTPVSGAELRFTSALDGTVVSDRSSRSGRFKVRLTVGRYTLSIVHHRQIFEGSSDYRVPSRRRIDVDYLLLPDFEEPKAPPPAKGGKQAKAAKPAEPPPPPIVRGPDAPAGPPTRAGTIVDMIHGSDRDRRGRWTELFAFLVGVLAVALAAD